MAAIASKFSDERAILITNHQGEVDSANGAMAELKELHKSAFAKQAIVHDAALRETHAELQTVRSELEHVKEELELLRINSRTTKNQLEAQCNELKASVSEAQQNSHSERVRAEAACQEASSCKAIANKSDEKAKILQKELTVERNKVAECIQKMERIEEKMKQASIQANLTIDTAKEQEAQMRAERDAALKQAETAETWLDRASAERSRLLENIAALKAEHGVTPLGRAHPTPTPPGSPKVRHRPGPMPASPTAHTDSRPHTSIKESNNTGFQRNSITSTTQSPKLDRRERQAAIKRYLAARAATPK